MFCTKKAPAILLLIAMTLSFAACSGASDNNRKPAETTAAAETTVIEGTYEQMKLPENLDFGGQKIRFVVDSSNDYYVFDSEGNPYENYNASEITVAELNSEPVNDAIYNRELYVEDLLNVEIERYEISKDSSIKNYLINMTMSGDSPGDIAAIQARGALWNADDEIFTDIMHNEYISLDSPWWFDDYTYAASIGDHLYACCGDLSLSLKRSVYVMFLNKKIAEDEGITDIYQTIFDGKWTLDYLTEVTSNIYHDLNGNSEADDEDRYGFITAETSVDPFWGAFDIKIFKKNADNEVEYCLDKERFYTATDKVKKLFSAKSTNLVGWREDELYQLFAEDGGLIAITRLVKAETEIMRNMQSEYGIIPLPKFDEKQENYYTMPSDCYTCFAIPMLAENKDASAAVLEAMAWYSYRYVTPAYFDVAMKGKYANDLDTRKMIDIIIDGYTVDIGWVSADKLYDYPEIWRQIACGNYESGASAIESKERKVNILVKEYNTLFDKYD